MERTTDSFWTNNDIYLAKLWLFNGCFLGKVTKTQQTLDFTDN